MAQQTLSLGIRITGDGSNAKAEIVSTSGALDKLGTAGKKAGDGMDKAKQSTDALAAAVNRAKGAFAGLATAAAAVKTIQIADAYTNLSSKLKIVAGTHQEFATAMADVSAIANQYQMSIDALGSTYSRIAPIVANMGKSQGDLKTALESVSAALKLSGATTSESAETLRQYAQALSGPTVQMEELNTLIDSSTVLWQGLQRQFPDLIRQHGSLKEAVGKGALSSQELLDATIRLHDELTGQANTMQTTVSGAFQVFRNELEKSIGKIDEGSGASKELAESLLSISKNLDAMIEPLTKVVAHYVKGFATILESVNQVRIALGDLQAYKDTYGVNQAIDPASRFSTGGGFGGAEETKKFDGVDKQIKSVGDSAEKAGAKVRKMNEDMAEGLQALARKWKLNETQLQNAITIYKEAQKMGVDPNFAVGLSYFESGLKMRGANAAGAVGLMQVIPPTFNRLKNQHQDIEGGISDSISNIRAGLHYIKQMSVEFGKKYGDGYRLAAAGYLAGEGSVRKAGGMPHKVDKYTGVTTEQYSERVMKNAQLVASLIGGSDLANWEKGVAEAQERAFEKIKTHQEDLIQQASEAAKVQQAKTKTSIAALEAEAKASEELFATQIAGAKTYDDKQKLADAAAKKAEEYSARAKALAMDEIAAQQKVIETQKAAYQNELQNADKYNVSEEDRLKIAQAIRAADADLMALTEQRAQTEIALSTKGNEAARQSADLKRQESQAVKDIIQDYTRQLEIFQRLSDAKAAGASSEQLSMLGNYYQSAQQLPDIVSADQLQRMEQYRLSTIAIKEATDQLTNSEDARKAKEQAVKDEQLRLNQAWTEAAERMTKYAADYEKAFGKMGKALAGVSAGMAEYSKQVLQINRDKAKAMEDAGKDAGKQASAEMKGQLETMAATFDMMGNVSGAMQSMFEEGTAGYKAMAVAQKVFQFATQMTNIALAIQAILNQGTGDPYTAIPRMVAVAGMVGALVGSAVGSFGGGGGGGGAKTAAQRQQETGTGGVWGDPSGQTQSIANSLEMLQKNSTNDLNYSAGMLRALESIDASIKGTTNAALINFRDMAAGMADKGKGYAGINDNKSISDWGIAFSKRALEVVLKKGMPLGDLYVSNNRSNSETTAQLGKDGPGQAIAQSIRSVTDALIEGGKAFGLTADDFKTRLKGFVVDLGIISLKGLKGDEIEKQFSIIMSNLSDKMAKRFMPGLDQFRKVGEGYSETFWRVAEGINRATGELEQLGLTAIDYKDVARKQGDVAAEMVRQTLQGQYYLTEGVREYIGELTGSAEDIISAYKKLTSASGMLRTGGFNADNMDRTMINAGGGLEAFTSALEKFNEEFLTTGEVLSGQVRDMGEAFTRLGQELPTSKDGFLSLVRGIDTSTEAGKKLFGQLMALSGAFADMQNQIEEIKQKYADILNPFAAIADRLKTVATDFQALIDAAAASIKSTGPEAKHISELEQSKFNLIDGKKGQKELLAKKAQDEADIAALEEKIAKEMEKKPGKRNKANLKAWNEQLKALRTDIINLDLALTGIAGQIAGIDSKILAAKASNDAALAVELAESRLKLVDQAGQAMTSELTKVFDEIAKTLEAAQQRLQSVLDLQKNLASQLAQIQGPQAVFALAQKGYDSAQADLKAYFSGIDAGRDVATETTLIQNAQQAVMDKYNAETAAIQEAERAYIAAETQRRNESLRAQSDAINAATDLAIEAENDRLNAAIKAQGKLDQAALKSQQKAFDAANKLTQKQFDAEQKALDKAHQAQLDALSKELDAANRVKDAIKAVGEYVKNMTLGANSPLSPEQKLAEAKRQFEALQSQAMGGDAEAIGKLTGASDAYLEAAKNYYGSGTQYSTTFEAIKAGLEATSGLSYTDPDSVQARIDSLREAQSLEMDALRESQAERLDAIREVQQEQLDAAREAQQEQLDAMRKASQDTQEAMRKSAQDQIEALQRANQQAIQDLSDPSKNEAMKAAREAAERDLQELQRLAELTRIEAQKQADEAAAAAKEQAQKAWDLANQQLAAINDGVGISRSTNAALLAIANQLGVTGIPAYAEGGIANPGLAIVGERGAELVSFQSPARVYSASDTKNILSGGDNSDILQALAEIQKEARASVVIQSSAYPQVIDRLTQMEDRLNQIERKAKLPA